MTSEPIDDQHFDFSGPIDLEALKKRICQNGPLRLFEPGRAVQMSLDLFVDNTENGGDDLFSVVLSSGVTTLSTLVDETTLKGFQSVSDLAETFFRKPHRVFSPAGELSYIKDQIGQHIGVDVEAIFALGIPAEGLKLDYSASAVKDPWMANNLEATLNALVVHRQMLDGVGRIDPEQTIRDAFPHPNDFIKLMMDHYDLGFLTARLLSENFNKNEIEPLAFKGAAFDEAQRQRTFASGKKASDKRHQRIEAVLGAMEELCAENPSIGRVGIRALADIAIKDCANADPQLWKQGKGQRDGYIDEMKSDLRYQSRFRALRL
ncbi:hypothetical protein [Loktanella salsilacus]|uniref:hypothetical protein n=1 Tax=Loktanella salsilacus TaxID=195913 RepID=UPI003001A2E4